MDCRGQVPHVGLQTAQPAPLPARLLPRLLPLPRDPPEGRPRVAWICSSLFLLLGFFFMGIANREMARLQLPGNAPGGCLGNTVEVPT